MVSSFQGVNDGLLLSVYLDTARGVDTVVYRAHGVDTTHGVDTAHGVGTIVDTAYGVDTTHGVDTAHGVGTIVDTAYGVDTAHRVDTAHGVDTIVDTAHGVDTTHGVDTAHGVGTIVDTAHGVDTAYGVDTIVDTAHGVDTIMSRCIEGRLDDTLGGARGEERGVRVRSIHGHRPTTTPALLIPLNQCALCPLPQKQSFLFKTVAKQINFLQTKGILLVEDLNKLGWRQTNRQTCRFIIFNQRLFSYLIASTLPVRGRPLSPKTVYRCHSYSGSWSFGICDVYAPAYPAFIGPIVYNLGRAYAAEHVCVRSTLLLASLSAIGEGTAANTRYVAPEPHDFVSVCLSDYPLAMSVGDIRFDSSLLKRIKVSGRQEDYAATIKISWRNETSFGSTCMSEFQNRPQNK
ncbi:hypothetical protein J6590_033393 [Homalodisca vitripennis]|nr:hypothetical protein J6590_033393 [Homalodisca vitripennis]